MLLCQVNSVTDVSRPLYAQLQKLTDTENSNVHVSATQSTQTQKVRQCPFLLRNCFTFFVYSYIIVVDLPRHCKALNSLIRVETTHLLASQYSVL